MLPRSTRRALSLPLAALAATVICVPAYAGTDGDAAPTPAPAFSPPPAPAPAPAATPVPVLPSPPPAVSSPSKPKRRTTHRPLIRHRTHRAHRSHRSKVATTHHTTASVVHAVVASVTPSGGVQAGEGGTAPKASDASLGILAPTGVAMLLLAGAGLRTRARSRS